MKMGEMRYHTVKKEYTKARKFAMGEVAWSHNDRTIATYGGDGKISLLDAQTGKVRTAYTSGVVYSLSWSPDDAYLVTGNYDNTARIWRLA